MKLYINPAHVSRWKAWLGAWYALVATCLVIGWHLKPRLDEIAFAICLPLIVIVPYAVLCLVAVAIQSLWPIRWQNGRFWRLLARFMGRNALGDNTGAEPDRRPPDRIPHV